LQGTAKSAIAGADVVLVSAATAWEAGIKASLGRLDLPDTVESGFNPHSDKKIIATHS
jgi:PIN domain nuclease of toxin-antitoxin system